MAEAGNPHPPESPLAADVRLRKLYEEYSTRLRRYLTRLLGSAEAADALQDVFLRAGRSLSAFRGDSSVSTWLYRIATNEGFRRLRNRRSGPPTITTSDIEGEVAALKCAAASPEEQAARREMNQCIRKLVEKLPLKDRAVLVLSELEGLQDNEIAEVVGLTLGATKIRLHRVRMKLKAQFQSECQLYKDKRNELACQPVANHRQRRCS